MAFTMVQGDLEPDMAIELKVNGEPEDISDALAFSMRWLKPDGSIVTAAALVEDIDGGGLETGRVKRIWVAGDTDVIGVHLAQIKVTRANGEVQTFPSNGTYVRWQIFAPVGA